ncbi:hypothetical protein [Clostridium sp. BJN0001]|uniref:hypothetical protein n=1 Tax=Clostridium sp. BJN0001 TaxID=2930219 RepID=UPI001FCFC8E9|nr:hypothetical protein [Clostridium sp. BJN0001]
MYIYNFSYLKGTDIENFYYKLLQAEAIFFKDEKVAKMIARSVVEGLLREKAKKADIDYEGGISFIISSLRLNPEIDFPVKIQKYIEIVREKTENKYSFEDIMIILNNILIWYIRSDKNYIFTPSVSVEDEEKYILKLRNEISIKEIEINKLRQKMMQQMESTNIIKINDTIIEIKKLKQKYENELKNHSEYFLDYKKQYCIIISKVNNYYSIYKDNKNKENIIKNNILNIESKLVNSEVSMKEIKDYIENLEISDNKLTQRLYFAKENISIIRKNYKILKFISKNLQDCLESYCFADNKYIKEKINQKIEDLNYSFKTNLSRLNDIIDEYIINSKDLKKSAFILKNIASDSMITNIRYKDFFRSFTNLDERRIKMLYVLISSYIPSIGIKNIINRPKIDDIYFYIQNEMSKIKNINKDEIHLVLYYKILKISNVMIFNIKNRGSFINSLDSIVDTSLQMFADNIEQNFIYDKIEILENYYINICISFFKKQSKNIFIRFSDEDIKNISYKIELLDSKILTSIYRNLEIMGNYTYNIKKFIETDIFKVIDILSEYNDKNVYRIILEVLYKISKIIGSDKGIVSYCKCKNADEFSSLQFMVTMLVLENRKNIKQSISNLSCCIQLIVMSIVISDAFKEESNITFYGYNRLISIWNAKKKLYTSLKESIKKKNRELYHYELTSIKNYRVEKEKEILIKDIESMQKKLNLIKLTYADIDNNI